MDSSRRSLQRISGDFLFFLLCFFRSLVYSFLTPTVCVEVNLIEMEHIMPVARCYWKSFILVNATFSFLWCDHNGIYERIHACFMYCFEIAVTLLLSEIVLFPFPLSETICFYEILSSGFQQV